VFKLRFLERVTIVVITGGHIEPILVGAFGRQANQRASPRPCRFYIRSILDPRHRSLH
jgi:hypothetical protein